MLDDQAAVKGIGRAHSAIDRCPGTALYADETTNNFDKAPDRFIKRVK
jgi:hypothetical protein